MPADSLHALLDDLRDEVTSLDAVMSPLDDGAWERSTPAPEWTVRDQIAHLWFFDQRATLALVDEEAFVAEAASLFANGDPSLARARSMTPAALRAAWLHDAEELTRIARDVDPSRRVPWYGPSMSARSFLTARLMETWAHGQDIVDALGVERRPTARLRHVAHIGVSARPYAYRVRQLAMPDVGVRVELDAPDGATWTWGDAASTDVITGDALDFCLVVTQRRHPADVDLVANGAAAREWLGIAQSFAGPPGVGRTAGQFAR